MKREAEMTLLCFLLDLRRLPLSLLRDLKQYLLQLANLYAVSPMNGRRGDSEATLRNQIALCFIHKNKTSSSNEIRFAYCPRGNFNLRDFHHAVNNLPTDGFLPISNDLVPMEAGNQEVSFTTVLSTQALYSWGGKDCVKKLIVISTLLAEDIEVQTNILMDAAEQCTSVEFVMLEQETNPCEEASEKIKSFINRISGLENCSLRRYLPDSWILCGLVKRWLRDLKDDVEKPLQAIFLFKNNLVGSADRLLCNLFVSSNQLIDGFTSCQICRCHGFPINGRTSHNLCPVTCCELGKHDMVENAARVGERTVLFLPSFQSLQTVQKVSGPITFNVIERTKLGTLSEGVLVGTSYVVTPTCGSGKQTTSDECDKSELNVQLFHGLCGALFLLDQGLVCSSTCNTETMEEAAFQCFYILQPSERGPMILRKLAASEEVLPVPEVIPSTDSVLPKEMQDCIQTSLFKMELRDYNPLLHERGFHAKLNCLVKESLQFGAIPPPKRTKPSSEPNSLDPLKSSTQGPATELQDEEIQPTQTRASEAGDTKSTPCVTAEDWGELLMVNDVSESSSQTIISKPKFESQVSTTSVEKPLDEKTCRILERLEVPKEKKLPRGRTISPPVASVRSDQCSGSMKRPLVPLGPSSSQLLKPDFQRPKRKHSFQADLGRR
ncbi:hypothetical protein QJS04_geneDACA021055 [Acorus gramineus]|uniref:Uncharacterized protein n=1 Tax=Acorus gramineus TaxID=55184 RepID=A0AAV9B365_ACOGR|nr:hypothetical protein QJS04_geneDACA021055 [Acorus gramineus]